MTEARYEHLYNLDAYDEGADGAEGGLDHTANPHKPGTDSHEAWALGWKEMDGFLNDVEASMEPDAL